MYHKERVVADILSWKEFVWAASYFTLQWTLMLPVWQKPGSQYITQPHDVTRHDSHKFQHSVKSFKIVNKQGCRIMLHHATSQLVTGNRKYFFTSQCRRMLQLVVSHHVMRLSNILWTRRKAVRSSKYTLSRIFWFSKALAIQFF